MKPDLGVNFEKGWAGKKIGSSDGLMHKINGQPVCSVP